MCGGRGENGESTPGREVRGRSISLGLRRLKLRLKVMVKINRGGQIDDGIKWKEKEEEEQEEVVVLYVVEGGR